MTYKTILTTNEGRQGVRGHNVILVLGVSLLLAAVTGAGFAAAFHYGAF